MVPGVDFLLNRTVFKDIFFRAEGGASGWDSAVSEASEIYGKNWEGKRKIERGNYRGNLWKFVEIYGKNCKSKGRIERGNFSGNPRKFIEIYGNLWYEL